MSRSGYSEYDGDDPLVHGRWRGAVASTIRGRPGQAFLREVLSALDAIPEKRLITKELKTAEGEFCTLGAVASARGMDLSAIDPDDHDQVAAAFGVNSKLAQEIMWENDESIDDFKYVNVVICGPMRNWERHAQNVRISDKNAEERRWKHMRNWVQKHIKTIEISS